MNEGYARLLEQASAMAERDPLGAWERRDQLYQFQLADDEALHLTSFALEVGGARLGRFADCADLLRRILLLPGIDPQGETARSTWRALAVVLELAGDGKGAEEARTHGVVRQADACRLAGMTAHLCLARGRIEEAVQALTRAAELCLGLPPGDPVLKQTADIARAAACRAKRTLREARRLLLAGAAGLDAAGEAAQEWRLRQLAAAHRGRAALADGDADRAAAALRTMMDLDDAHQAGPEERFLTAALAYRHHRARGQATQARQALEACRDFASRAAETCPRLAGKLKRLEDLSPPEGPG